MVKPLAQVASELYKRHEAMVSAVKTQSSQKNNDHNIPTAAGSSSETSPFKELVRNNLKSNITSIKNNLAISSKFAEGKASLLEVQHNLAALDHKVKTIGSVLNKIIESWKKFYDTNL